MFSLTKTLALLAVALITTVRGETHTVMFENHCGAGIPMLIAQDGTVLSTGAAYNSTGPIIDAIAFLQTGSCGAKGEGCSTVDITLQNPTSPGGGSSADITVVPPHAFSVVTGFGYFNGCDGAGMDCTIPGCPNAFLTPGGPPIVVACQTDNVNLVVTFCD
ncbi:glycopeptide [Roridomyces roridus]|uniref:Glycopeptide n=1 Tax=Roridomyces roridus TaxID=1738132 RepID=A0AAD7BQV0_9AGAR|nr:glycopeptide [Roridomyces roridus]